MIDMIRKKYSHVELSTDDIDINHVQVDSNGKGTMMQLNGTGNGNESATVMSAHLYKLQHILAIVDDKGVMLTVKTASTGKSIELIMNPYEKILDIKSKIEDAQGMYCIALHCIDNCQ